VALQLGDLLSTPFSLETPRRYTVLWTRNAVGSEIQTSRAV